MPNEEDDVNVVRVLPASDLGSNRANGFIVRDAGCPNDRHPMRWCGCKVFYNKPDAVAYAAELRTQRSA